MSSIKKNEEADKAEKQTIDIPGMTKTRQPYTDYYLTIRKARNSEWQREWKNSTIKLHYTVLNHASKNGRGHTIRGQTEQDMD